MRPLPEQPFELAEPVPFRPAAVRRATLFGAPVELTWLPDRAARRGRPGRGRPAFPASFVERILADETVWSDDRFALTPNRHPFAARQLLLWSRTPRREPDAEMLAFGARLAEASGGTLLVNSIGAAASIPWAHAHLLGERGGFLDHLPLEACELPLAGADPALGTFRAAAPFPVALVALRGATAVRAAAAARSIALRACPAFNLVDDGTTTWLLPRALETPTPHFPQALGAAELWGRWCYDDESAFRAATGSDLAAALAAAGCVHD